MSELLDAIGGIVDKPGRAARGLISNLLSPITGASLQNEWLNLVPYSDAMGITDPGNRVSGQDLLQQLGVLKPGDTTLGPVAGMVAELATDPLNILGGVGLAKGVNAYRSLKQASALRKEIAALDKIEDAARIGGGMTGQAGDIGDLMRLGSGGLRTDMLTGDVGARYLPELIEELPSFLKPVRPLTYNRVTPEASELITRLGLGSQSGPGSVTVMQRPSFLQGRGGKMFLTEGAPKNMQYTDLVQRGSPLPTATIGMLPESEAAAFSRMPLYKAGEGGKYAHAVDMPFLDAQEAAKQMREIKLKELADIENNVLVRVLRGIGLQ